MLQRLPFKVEVIQTDNGAEFQSSFHYHVLDKGIAHTYIKPASPHLNGRWNARTASTAKSSTSSSRAWSSTTPASSTPNSKNGRTTTTTTAPTAHWAGRPLRAPQAEDPGPGVTKLRQLYSFHGFTLPISSLWDQGAAQSAARDGPARLRPWASAARPAPRTLSPIRRRFRAQRGTPPPCPSVGDMGGVIEPVLGEVGVAVDADVGGLAVGDRESSG